MHDSCILLNLLPGSAVLLRDVLMASSKRGNDDENGLVLVQSLQEIGVKNISPEMALRILSSRVDWPKF